MFKKKKNCLLWSRLSSVDNQCLMDTLPFKQHNSSFISNGPTECISLPSSTLLLPVLYSNYHLSYPLKGFFALVFTSWDRGVQNVRLVPAACCVFPATRDWMLGLISSHYTVGLWQSTLSSLRSCSGVLNNWLSVQKNPQNTILWAISFRFFTSWLTWCSFNFCLLGLINIC